MMLGFLVASVTGNRPLGGVVLVVGGALCAWWMQRLAGWWRTSIVLVVALGLFVLSHPLGNVIGGWPSVILVGAVTGGLAWLLATPAHR